MAGQRDDRRVQFTKMLLRESMIKLLHEKPVAKITIKELCEGADINRGTFYTHFTDQYDLLRHTEDTAIEEIGKYITAIITETIDENVKEACTNLFCYIKKNEHFWRSLLSENGSVNFYKKLYDMGYSDFLSRPDKTSTIDDATWKLMYTFSLIGGIGMTMRWLEEENDQTPEQMANILYRLIKSDTDILALGKK